MSEEYLFKLDTDTDEIIVTIGDFNLRVTEFTLSDNRTKFDGIRIYRERKNKWRIAKSTEMEVFNFWLTKKGEWVLCTDSPRNAHYTLQEAFDMVRTLR